MRGLAVPALMLVFLVALVVLPLFAGRAFALGETLGRDDVDLPPQAVEALLVGGQITLVDVREKNEFDLEHIAGAVLMPLSTFDASKLPAVSQGKPVVFYCRSGRRSDIALQQAVAAGIGDAITEKGADSVPKLSHMAGGILAWKAKRLAHLEKTDGLTECLLCSRK